MRGAALAGEGIRGWGVPGQLRLELPLSLRCQSVRSSVYYSTVDRLMLGRRCGHKLLVSGRGQMGSSVRGQASRLACGRCLMPLHLGLVEASRLQAGHSENDGAEGAALHAVLMRRSGMEADRARRAPDGDFLAT